MDKLDIMRAIKERGLIAKDIAHKMGITHIAMSQRINGNPRLDTLRNLAAAIGCNIGDFFYPIEEDSTPKEGLFAQKQQLAEASAKNSDVQPSVNTTTFCPHCGAKVRVGVVLLPED